MVKPVAWMETYKGEPNNLDWNKENLNYGDSVYDVIPLYTAPRELSDEEIDLFTKQFFNIWIGAELSEQFRIKLYELEEFARAILRKAQEK